MNNRRIVIEGLDGVGKSTIVDSLSTRLNFIKRKYPTSKVIDSNNRNIASITNLLHKAESIIKSEINMDKYYKLIDTYKHISEKYLEFTCDMIIDQFKEYNEYLNISIDTHNSINDRGLVSTFIFNYMEYVFFDLICQRLLSFDIFQNIYIDYRCGIFNTNIMRKILNRITDEIIKITIPSNMIKYWKNFNNILLKRFKMPDNIDHNTITNVIILTLDNTFRIHFLNDKKHNDIKYKEFFEREDKQNRYNCYLEAFKTSDAYKINNKYINSIHFIDAGYYDRKGIQSLEDEYKRLPADAVVNMILRELKMEELI